MRSTTLRLTVLLALAAGLGLAAGGRAATIDIRYSTLVKLLTDPSSPDGRKYLNGKRGDACAWTYVDAPRVEAAGTRVRLSAQMRGAVAFAGGCLQMEGELPVEVLAQPVYRDGVLELAQPEIHVQGETAGGVSGALLGGLLRLVRVPVREKVAGLLATTPDGVLFKLNRFDVDQLEVRAEGIRLTVSFGLEVQ
jgi:hypothetical protein